MGEVREEGGVHSLNIVVRERGCSNCVVRGNTAGGPEL